VSRAAHLFVRPLQDSTDPLSGFFALRRERLLEAGADARGFKLGLEVILHGGESLRLAEVPIEFHDRQRGVSKLGAKEALTYLERVFDLLGGAETRSFLLRFAAAGWLSLAVDLAAFHRLLALRAELVAAHVSAFLIATVFNYAAHAWWESRERSSGRSRFTWWSTARALAVAVLALSIRGAIIVLAVRHGVRPELALVLGVITAAPVNYAGRLLFVFDAPRRRLDSGLLWRGAAFGLCAYLLLLRLCYLGLPSLLVEEAYYWNYAQHPALSYLDHPPMVAVLIRAGTFVFGDTEFGVRAPAFACSLVWLYFGSRLARNLFDRSVAIRTALLLTILPFFVAFGFFMTPDSPLIACWAGTLFFLERAILAKNRFAWYGVGVCLGLGLVSKYTIILVVPATLLFLAIHAPGRIWFRRKEPYLALALAFAIFSPVLIWNAQHNWASFAFQGPRRMSEDPGFGLPRLIGSVFVLLSPTAALAAFYAIARNRESAQTGEKTPAVTRRFALVFSLVPASVFAVFSLTHADVRVNWTGPAWLTVLPLIASYTMTVPASGLPKVRDLLSRMWRPTFAVLVPLYALALHYLVLGAPGLDYPDSRLFGWENLAEQVEAIEDHIEAESGAEPLVIGLDKYNISSALAFYRSKLERDSDDSEEREGVRETSGRHVLGKDDLMYRYWFRGRPTTGRTVIMVDDQPERLSNGDLSRHFERLSEMQTIHATQNGKPSGVFFLRVGYGLLDVSS
jgi:dolichol-phosphate mannosyltransferase